MEVAGFMDIGVDGLASAPVTCCNMRRKVAVLVLMYVVAKRLDGAAAARWPQPATRHHAHEPHHHPSYPLPQEIRLKSHGFLAVITRIDRSLLGLGAARVAADRIWGEAGEGVSLHGIPESISFTF